MPKNNTDATVSWDSEPAPEAEPSAVSAAKQALAAEMNEGDERGSQISDPDFSWEGEDPTPPEPEEGPQPEGDDPKPEPESEGEDPQPEEGDPETEEEEGDFYNPEELYPDDDVHPNQFKTKYDAVKGVVHKAKMLNDMYTNLQDYGVDPNAIDLPDFIEGNVDNLKDYFDHNKVADMDDEQIRKIIYTADKHIPSVKDIVADQKTSYEANKQVSNLESYVEENRSDTLNIVQDDFDIDPNDPSVDTDEKLVKAIDSAVKDAHKDDRQDLINKRNKVVEFLNKTLELQKLKDSGPQKDTEQYSEEDFKNAFVDFRKLNRNSEIFKHESVLDEFMAYVDLNGDKFEMHKPSGWKRAERSFLNQMEELKKKTMAKKAKERASEDKPTGDRNRQPEPKFDSRFKDDPYRQQRKSLNDEKKALAREMTVESKQRRG